MPLEPISTAIFFSAASQQIIEAIVRPVKQKFPNLDMWWLIYVTWVAGGALSWLANLNLFSQYFVNPEVGRILTAFVVGGGSQLVSEVFKGISAWRASIADDIKY